MSDRGRPHLPDCWHATQRVGLSMMAWLPRGPSACQPAPLYCCCNGRRWPPPQLWARPRGESRCDGGCGVNSGHTPAAGATCWRGPTPRRAVSTLDKHPAWHATRRTINDGRALAGASYARNTPILSPSIAASTVDARRPRSCGPRRGINLGVTAGVLSTPDVPPPPALRPGSRRRVGRVHCADKLGVPAFRVRVPRPSASLSRPRPSASLLRPRPSSRYYDRGTARLGAGVAGCLLA